MGYFGDYQRKPIEAGYVDQEGDYQVKITGIKQGTLTDKDNKVQQYTQVMCLINYKGQPNISIFLTEGKNFDGNFTAFCDTFGIKPAQDMNSWIGKTGYIHILLKKKDGFTNMVPRWILGDNGYVLPEVVAAAGVSANPVYTQPMQQQPGPSQAHTGYGTAGGEEYGDIPF